MMTDAFLWLTAYTFSMSNVFIIKIMVFDMNPVMSVRDIFTKGSNEPLLIKKMKSTLKIQIRILHQPNMKVMNILKIFDSLHLSSSIKNEETARMKNNRLSMEIHQFNNCQQSTSSQAHLVKYIATIILLSITLASRATPSAYSKQMKSAIDRLKVSESTAEYETLAREFETISNLNTGKWLPKYYTAAYYVFITLLEDSNLNEDQIESYQDKAEAILDDLQEDHENESELHA